MIDGRQLEANQAHEQGTDNNIRRCRVDPRAAIVPSTTRIQYEAITKRNATQREEEIPPNENNPYSRPEGLVQVLEQREEDVHHRL